MQRGTYIRTKEILEKQSKSHKGKLAWNKGIPTPYFIREKISLTTKKAMTPETRLKISKSRSGKAMSEETKKKIASSLLGFNRGEKHYNWKGGITALTKQIRQSFQYRQWRSDVYTRDDFTCQFCFKKGMKLQADHIKQFAQIIADNRITTLEEAINCAELWNINNGRTLCIPCHKTTPTFAVNIKNTNVNKKIK